MFNKRIILGVAFIALLAMAYRTVTYNCGPGCTTDPKKIAAGCPACPTQEEAYPVTISTADCPECMAPTEDFFHDSIYTPATEDI